MTPTGPAQQVAFLCTPQNLCTCIGPPSKFQCTSATFTSKSQALSLSVIDGPGGPGDDATQVTGDTCTPNNIATWTGPFYNTYNVKPGTKNGTCQLTVTSLDFPSYSPGTFSITNSAGSLRIRRR